MKVEKTDMKLIGHTTFWASEEKTTFLLNSSVEIILLRNLLELFGCEILSIADFVWENGNVDIEVVTNLPKNEYLKIN